MKKTTPGSFALKGGYNNINAFYDALINKQNVIGIEGRIKKLENQVSQPLSNLPDACITGAIKS